VTNRAGVAAVGCSLSYCLVVAASFFCFLAACDVGLHMSATPDALAEMRPWAIGGVLVGITIVTLSINAVMRWRVRSIQSARWVVAGVLGLLTAGVAGAFALVGGFLLTSATWGSHAGADFFERNLLVEAASPAWLWWLLVNFLACAGISGVLMLGPTTSVDGERPFRWYAYVVLAAVPISILGTLWTTATLAL
jgi:hypothetical protein